MRFDSCVFPFFKSFGAIDAARDQRCAFDSDVDFFLLPFAALMIRHSQPCHAENEGSNDEI